MKFMWFHLMPYTELPEDFRDAHPSVWVDIHSSLFDPRRAHHMYNDFMDELEFAAHCGFDAICVNEHHSNGYGLMPSPNLIASSLARRTTDTAICVMGNSLALYNPPTRVAEEFAMIDVISGGRLIAGFPVGTPMDTCYAYGQNPSMLRERYREAHVDRARDLCLQRPLQPAALRQQLAAAGAAAASAGLGPRRRVDRDLAVVRRDGLRLQLSLLLRLQSRPRGARRLLAGDGAARQGPESLSRGLPAVRRRRREPRRGHEALRGAGGVLLRPLPARRREVRGATRLQQRGNPAGGHPEPGGAGRRRGRVLAELQPLLAARAGDGRDRRPRLHRHRIARRGRRAAQGGRDLAQCRTPHAAAAVRQHEQGPHALQHQALRREGDAAAQGLVLGVGGPLVAAADGAEAPCGGSGFPAAGQRRG